MSLTQLMALAGGTLLVTAALLDKKPGEVFRDLIAKSKSGGSVAGAAKSAVTAAENVTGQGTVATAARDAATATAAQYQPGTTAIAKFN